MIGTKLETLSWRETVMARKTSPSESHASPAQTAAPGFKKAPLEASAWDPYEVWLTRVKQPRDARELK